MTCIPDYRGRSLVNLMASLRTAMGAPSRGYAPLSEMGLEELTARHVMLVVADGMGEMLMHDSPLARYRRTTLTSVFPTTTASAVTSLYTGVGPLQHGMTGWFTWLRELGSVATVLPFVPRHGGDSYTRSGIEPHHVLRCDSVLTGIERTRYVVNPVYISDSAYSRALSGSAERVSYRDLAGMMATLAAISRHSEASMTMAYWPELDSLAHDRGVHSDAVREARTAFEQALDTLLDSIAGTDTLVLVTADHGLVDTAPECVLRLEEHPALAADLVLPLCGEPRAAFAYVHPDRNGHFEEYVGTRLAAACELIPRAQLLADGWFGLGEAHPEFAHRIGDYLLLARDRWVITQRLSHEKPFSLRATHGGLSADELYVPLLAIRP